MRYGDSRCTYTIEEMEDDAVAILYACRLEASN